MYGFIDWLLSWFGFQTEQQHFCRARERGSRARTPEKKNKGGNANGALECCRCFFFCKVLSSFIFGFGAEDHKQQQQQTTNKHPICVCVSLFGRDQFARCKVANKCRRVATMKQTKRANIHATREIITTTFGHELLL